MKWIKKILEVDMGALIIYWILVVIVICLYGGYLLLDKLIDKL